MEDKLKKEGAVIFAKNTVFNGVLKFERTVSMRGKFTGTIDATGSLIVDKDAIVDADKISAASISVLGKVSGDIYAKDNVELCTGAEVRGDISAKRLRIADGVLFEGLCTMLEQDADIEGLFADAT